MFENYFPIFLHFGLPILHDQVFSDCSNYPKIGLCSLTSRVLSVVLGCIVLFWFWVYVCIVLVLRSKDGRSLHYLDLCVSDFTMFSDFCA